ncbi:MAG TPA: type II secretion system F family protein [Nocardioidaceae bacterium]|nr:type II secretion system F family protein [Nocardioidaceae bacterium]
MTLALWGLLLGAAAGIGVAMIASRVVAVRRSALSLRVLPYLHDLSAWERPGAGWRHLLGRLAVRADDILGGTTSVRRRLERAGLQATVHDFRVEQVVWGLAAFAGAASFSVVVALHSPDRVVPLLVLCGISLVLGVLLRDNRLSAQVAARDQRVLAEFPTVAELLALAVAAGEGPVAALERVVGRCRGALAEDLSRVLADVRTGTPVAVALDAFGNRSGLPVVARFASGMAVAVERGTPLADVLHAQAADVREARRRALIESGARREVLMMVPVVFLVLPVTVVFAFWPGVVGLDLVTP